MTARGAMVLMAIGLLLGVAPARGVNLLIQDGKLVSPAESAPDSAEFLGQGCLGCTDCPANLRTKTCSAAVFTTLDNAFEQLFAYSASTCAPAGCRGVFASIPCDLSWITFDPNFRPAICAKEVGLIPMPTLSQFALLALSVVMLAVGTLWLRRRVRATDQRTRG